CGARVRAGTAALGDDGRDIVDRLQHRLPFIERSCPARHEREEGLAVQVVRDEWEWGRDLEGRESAELLGGVDDEVSIEPDDVARVLQLEEHGTAVDVLDRLQLELERRHDAEVSASATEGPEQIRVDVLVRYQKPAVRRHDVGRDQIVAGEA